MGTLYYLSPEQLQAQANGQEIDFDGPVMSGYKKGDAANLIRKAFKNQAEPVRSGCAAPFYNPT